MKNQAFVGIAMVGALLFSREVGYAQQNNDRLLNGTYRFHTTGQAQLTEDSNCAARGLIVAGLTDGSLLFDGGGHITQGRAGISVGGTNCTSSNYAVTGTYTVTAVDGNSFTAEGVLNFTFGGRPAACQGTKLGAQPFSLIGTRNDRTATGFTIQTSGADPGATYAEGPAPGPLSCTANIVNFVTSGPGTKNP